MGSWLGDLRLALRGLRQAPAFTLVTTLTVGLGIGATSTIVSIGSGALLRAPAGVRDAGRLVTAHAVSQNGSSFHSFSAPDFRDYQAAVAGQVELAAYSTFPASLRATGDPVLRMGMIVTGNYFSVLGTRPAWGRLFGPDDDRPGAAPVAVLSHAEWRSRFGGDSGVVGRTLLLNGQLVTVVGVAEPGFHGQLAPLDVGVWIPLAQTGITAERARLDERRASWLEVVGRLGPGVTAPAAGARLSTVAARIGRENGADFDRRIDVRAYHPVPAQVALPALGFFGLLLLLSGVVLLIVCINVASVLLARAVSRRKEIAVRLALGASRARLLRQLVTESLVLFLLGGSLGCLIAIGATRGLAQLPLPVGVPLALDFQVDGLALGITLAIALLTGVGVGLVPARQAGRTDLTRALKNDGASGAGRLRLRSAFVVAQVAASVVLLAAAGLMSRALGAAGSVDLGFVARNVHAASFELRVMGWTPEQTTRFGEALLDRARALPGVEGAALTDLLPLTLSSQSTGVTVPGREEKINVGIFPTDFTDVSPGYFRTMGIPLVRGRLFTDEDRAGAPGVVIVNETLAHQIWGDDDPVGKPLGYGGFRTTTPVVIVGVVRDAKYRSVGEDPVPMTYVPVAQATPNALSLVLQTDGRVGMAALVRDLVRSLQPDLPLAANASLESMTSIALLPNRIAAGLAGGFGGVGLLLAAIGLYGVLAYGVSLRRRELGIRLALGAGERAVRRLVLEDGLRLTAVGLLIGLALAAGLGRLLRTLLYGVSPLDPVTFTGIAGLLVAVALLAADPPARRAARTEPLEALRAE